MDVLRRAAEDILFLIRGGLLGEVRRRGDEGRHKACPYRVGVQIVEAVPRATRGQAQGLPLQERYGGLRRPCRGRREGRHKACPYRVGVQIAEAVPRATRGQAQGLPLQERYGGLRRPCRGRREGRHKACPYRSGMGDCGGRAEGDERAGTRPAPTGAVCRLWRPCRGRREGRHKACPYRSGVQIVEAVPRATRGQAQGLPLQERCADCGGRAEGDERAGTRPAPTGLLGREGAGARAEGVRTTVVSGLWLVAGGSYYWGAGGVEVGRW